MDSFDGLCYKYWQGLLALNLASLSLSLSDVTTLLSTQSPASKHRIARTSKAATRRFRNLSRLVVD